MLENGEKIFERDLQRYFRDCHCKMEDEADVSVLCETNGLANMQNLDDTNMSKLGQQDPSSVSEDGIYEMIVELEALSIQHIDALQKKNGIDFRCALHIRLSVPEQNSDFSDVNFDPVRSMRSSAPPPPPKRFQRRRNTAQHGLNEDL